MGTISFQPAICFQIYFASYSVSACPFLWKAFKQPTTDSTAEVNGGNRHVNLTNVKSRWDVEHKDWMVGDEESVHNLTEAGMDTENDHM